MCLWDHGIKDGGDVIRVRRARGISKDDGGVGRGRGIDNTPEVSETTTGAVRIQVQRRRLRHRDDGSEELVTTAEASAEKDEPKYLTTTTEVSAEEVEETMCL